MSFASWRVDAARPILATAIHAGHELRPEIAARMALDDATRRREEDSHTGVLAEAMGSHVVVHRSRFEVDLNRDRETAVYRSLDDAWGLEVWKEPPGTAELERSRGEHDDFYRRLGSVLDDLAGRHGGFVVYDLHSYNHRRDGPGATPADPDTHPLVNLGTGSLPERWRPVADTFLEVMGAGTFGGEPIDARENIVFLGRELARFVHERYGDVGAALAIEFKKAYMDEWTDRAHPDLLDDLRRALVATVEPVWKAHQACR